MNHERDEKKFMEVFAEYGDAIFRFCLIKVSQVEQAEDMTQETFMRYWQYVREGKEITNARSLLYTIANNLAKDWYKKKKSISLDTQIEAGQQPRASDATAPDVQAEYTETLRAMNDLEAGDQIVLLMRHVEGLPPKEIAQALSESANTISVRINRAEKRLKTLLAYE